MSSSSPELPVGSVGQTNVIRVVLACALLALPLWWFSQVIDWAAWRVTPWARVAALAVALLTAAITYGVALWALRVPLQTLWRR